MKPALRKGYLSTWKDDRGFGFIKPDDGSKEIFLHISGMRPGYRRPKVGDTILYELKADRDGKVRAVNASIEGVVLQSLLPKRKDKSSSLIGTLLGLCGLVGFVLFTGELSRSRYPSPISSITKPDCIIKGNVSIDTGRRIYHLPGMEDYETTVIDPASGEEWFCTEAEAIAAGWRKAPR